MGQGLTFTGFLIFALSNSNPARATAFVAYIQVMRLNVIEFTGTAMSTFLRVREQTHSNLVGLHVSAGDSEVGQALARLSHHFLEHSASAETAAARAAVSLVSLIDGFTVAFWAAIAGLLLISLMREHLPDR